MQSETPKRELTNNEQSARLLIEKSGLPEPHCYRCIWRRDLKPKHKFYSTCACPVAEGIKAYGTVIRSSLNNPSMPLFPLVNMGDEGEPIPALIGLEFGVNAGLVAWPTDFDPLYILWCVFFTTKEQAEEIQANTDESAIDKGIPSL